MQALKRLENTRVFRELRESVIITGLWCRVWGSIRGPFGYPLVGTSDIVGRAMILATSHHISLNEDEDDGKVVGRKRASSATLQFDMVVSYACAKSSQCANQEPSVSSGSRFFPTERLVSCFSARVEAQKPGQRVVYIDGAFDMFHAGEEK